MKFKIGLEGTPQALLTGYEEYVTVEFEDDPKPETELLIVGESGQEINFVGLNPEDQMRILAEITRLITDPDYLADQEREYERAKADQAYASFRDRKDCDD